ncbi:MAG: peptidoglycan DD-metalloendopeptidase family protein [Pseudomonadota bacterium]
MSSKKHTYLSTACVQLIYSKKRVINILITLCFLVACVSSGGRAPIRDRQSPPSTKVVTHEVMPGETLYSIAWRYGLNYKGLAKANGIAPDFRIFPGQIIYLADNVAIKEKPQPATGAPPSAAKKPIETSINTSSPVPAPAQKSKVLSASKTPSVRPEKKSILPDLKKNPAQKKAIIVWSWPARGRVLTNFYIDKGLKKGIDIQGKKGDSVLAAASGKIVYAGSGLRGYGKLVIIKHNDTYLSAYAHNYLLRVKEGDIVKRGQHIADIGSTGIGAKGLPRLHFQIRKDGKPINPLPLLPKR